MSDDFPEASPDFNEANGFEDPDASAPATARFVQLTLGPPIVGYVMQIFITGLCAQLAVHYMFPAPSRSRSSSSVSIHSQTHGSVRSRMLCAAIVFANLITFGLCWASLMHWSTVQVQMKADTWDFPKSDALIPLSSGLVALMVQSVFAQRAYRFCGNSIIFAVFITLAILLAFAGACGICATSFMDQDLESTWDLQLIMNQIQLITTAAVDIIIAGVLIIKLAGYSADFSNTRKLLKRIMAMAFETAAVTASFALAAAIIYVITHDHDSASVYAALNYPLSALYTFSYLWSLVSASRASNRNDVMFHSDFSAAAHSSSSGSGAVKIKPPSKAGRPPVMSFDRNGTLLPTAPYNTMMSDDGKDVHSRMDYEAMDIPLEKIPAGRGEAR